MPTITTARRIMRQRLAEMQESCDALRQAIGDADFMLDAPIDQQELLAYAKEATLDVLAKGNGREAEEFLDVDFLDGIIHASRTDFLDAFLDQLAEGMPLAQTDQTADGRYLTLNPVKC